MINSFFCATFDSPRFFNEISLLNPERSHRLTDLLVNLSILINGSLCKMFLAFGVDPDAISSLNPDTFHSYSE